MSSAEYVLIEISTHTDLAKIREDINKLSGARNYLFSQNVFPRCYFVTSAAPLSSARTTAEQANIAYRTFDEFESEHLGGNRYKKERSLRRFGSAVQVDDGLATDEAPYIPITYFDNATPWTVENIADALTRGEKIVLVGEFGAGKSRCAMETFSLLAEREAVGAPIAVNLRDAWGKNTSNSILREHLEDLGLATYADSLIRSMSRGKNPIILDGFDELGSQAWGTNPERMREIRAAATRGVRDIAEKFPSSGMLISGRDHYFSSRDEMLRCLGLPAANTTVLTCPSDFTEEQATEYLQRAAHFSLKLPPWMPRKPLICQLIASFSREDVQSLLSEAGGEVDFFTQSLGLVCERETRIAPIIDPQALEQLLIRLALVTKSAGGDAVELTPADISREFKNVTGTYPGEESAVLLQKIPYLGRFQPDNPNRIFVDEYVREGLAGLGVRQMTVHELQWNENVDWQRPLGSFGLRVCGHDLSVSAAVAFARRQLSIDHYQVAADIVAALLTSDEEELDFASLSLTSAHFSELALIDKSISRLAISGSMVDNLIVDNFESSDFYVGDTLIERASGIPDKDSHPSWINDDVQVSVYASGMNSAAISSLGLTDPQKTLLSIIQKLFGQRGSGRKESALLRGTSRYWDQAAAEKMLRTMEREGVVSRANGKSETIYVPNREFTRRMMSIRSELRASKDPLWLLASD